MCDMVLSAIIMAQGAWLRVFPCTLRPVPFNIPLRFLSSKRKFSNFVLYDSNYCTRLKIILQAPAQKPAVYPPEPAARW